MVLAGRYQVEAIIGKGGSGIVLRAFDRTAQTLVAVKVLKQELVHDERWSKRFSRELRLGRPIRHPNVCRIFDIGEGDGHRFLTMELANGGTLRDLIKRGEPLRPLDERLKDAAAAIGGLAAIHEAGIVHRDVKPDNMLRMDDGRLALSDFGLATDLPTATAVTVMVGTPHYMAPEVRAGEPATTRSDVWALGVVLYEIFFGKRPERRSSLSSEGLSKPPAPLTHTPVERAMLALCERCLAENPLERPADARVVAQLFEGARFTPLRFMRGRRIVTTLVAILAVAIGVGVAFRGIEKAYRRQVTSPGPGTNVIVPTGTPSDWSRVATTLASIPGRVHCFTMLDDSAARIVWGTPKRVEDIDLTSGVRHRSNLLPLTYASGCPQRAPKGSSLLFVGQTVAGTSEIRLSAKGDGTDAISVTPGSEPIWLRSGEEFVYNLDSGHVAVFSIATMRYSLLADPGLGGRQLVADKGASSQTDTVALLFLNDRAEPIVAIYEGEAMDLRVASHFPASVGVRFDEKDRLLVSHQLSASKSTLATFDWRAGSARELGLYPDLDLVDFARAGPSEILLGRHLSRDLWLYDGFTRRELTTDGETTSGAISRNGDLLLGKRDGDGSYRIWRSTRDGSLKALTSGPLDSTPDFSPDAKSWIYADYAAKRIVLCPWNDGKCEPVREDDQLPTWPRFSPDGQKIAYVTQVSPSRNMILDLKSRRVSQLGSSHPECPPVWSSATTVWSFEGSPHHYSWCERDVTTGTKTGRQIAMAESLVSLSEDACWPDEAAPDSPLFRRLRVESKEESRLLRLAVTSFLR
jgi:dipeptidyl aminopeptidase/acylaminoacyl peptidase